MDTTIILVILLGIVGLYAFIRGLVMGKPISRRHTFRELADMFLGLAGLYVFLFVSCVVGYVCHSI